MRASLRHNAVAALILACASSAVQGQTVYHGFTLLDPTAQHVTENTWIIVTGTTIAEVGHGRPPVRAGYTHVDMAGHYALPGFIDAHAHVTTGVRRVDVSGAAPVMKEEPSDSITRFNALVALASGVTTIRNPAGVPEANIRYADRIRSGEWVGPDVLHAGTLFGGYPLDWAAQPEGERGWHDAMERERRSGFTLVKLYTALSEQELALGISAAHAQGLHTIAHLDRVSWTRAAALGVDALTHALPTSEDLLVEPARSAYIASRKAPSARFMYQWFEYADLDSAPIREMIRTLAERNVVVDLTLVVNELVYWFDRIDSLPLMQQNDWMHPTHTEPWRQQMGASLYDWSADDFARAKAVMPKVLEFARRIHAAGVPMLIGTDGTGGGPLFARELELHVSAGLSSWEVLALATTRAAERLGLAARTGALETGLEADIVFLAADPVADIANVGRVATVVVDGRAHQRGALIERARRFAGQSADDAAHTSRDAPPNSRRGAVSGAGREPHGGEGQSHCDPAQGADRRVPPTASEARGETRPGPRRTRVLETGRHRTMMEYKGYLAGPIDFDAEDGTFSGTVSGIRDVIHFEGSTAAQLRRAFKDSIDAYLGACEADGRAPDRPFSGRFPVRVPSELHRKAAVQAAEEGLSLNAWIARRIENAVGA